MDTRMSPRDLYERGRMLRQAKMYDKALADFTSALQDPYYAGKAHTQVALCFRALGRHAEAAQALQQALDSGTLSANEHLHVLYLLGQTLESLGRYAEALEAYGWVRQQKAGFLDVEERIKQLCAAGSGTPIGLLTRRLKSADFLRVYRSLQERGLAFFRRRKPLSTPPSGQDHVRRRAVQETMSRRRGSADVVTGKPADNRDNPMVQRRHARVGMRCRSQFASNSQMLAGEGELRDLSPGGCRFRSSVNVPVGAKIVCWIFPQNAVEPLTIEGATVRWTQAQEFGVAFAQLPAKVERQIARLCASPS